MTNKIYNQSGGWLDGIGAYLIGIVKEILIAILEFIKAQFKIWPKTKEMDGFVDWFNLTKKWDWGNFWIYIKWCFKVVIYLILFCFGGPIVILAGIIYLYSKLGTKLATRAKSTNNVNSKNI